MENTLLAIHVNSATNEDNTNDPRICAEVAGQNRFFRHGAHPEHSRRDGLGGYVAFGDRHGGLRSRSSHSTDRITNASQVEQVAYRHRAFGEQTVVSGSNPNRFTWVGRLGYYRQPDPGNYWLRARIYEDDQARFLSRDPAQEEINLYRYVTNRPLVLVDPSGRQGCRPGVRGMGAWPRGGAAEAPPPLRFCGEWFRRSPSLPYTIRPRARRK